MPLPIAVATIDLYCRVHTDLLARIDAMPDAALTWQPAPHAPSIGFHLWTVARWADHMQAVLPGMTPVLRQRLGARPQIWARDGVGAAWGLDAALSDYAEVGVFMHAAPRLDLPLPGRAALLGYVRAAFTAVETVVWEMGEDQFHAAEQLQPLTEDLWQEGTVGLALMEHIAHDSRHVGAIECLYTQFSGTPAAEG